MRDDEYKQGFAANNVIEVLQESTPGFGHAMGELAIAVRLFCTIGAKFGQQSEAELYQQFLQILERATVTIGDDADQATSKPSMVHVSIKPFQRGH